MKLGRKKEYRIENRLRDLISPSMVDTFFKKTSEKRWDTSPFFSRALFDLDRGSSLPNSQPSCDPEWSARGIIRRRFHRSTRLSSRNVDPFFAEPRGQWLLIRLVCVWSRVWTVGTSNQFLVLLNDLTGCVCGWPSCDACLDVCGGLFVEKWIPHRTH